MVVAGLHEGKNEICSRVGYFKYGVDLKTEKPTPKQIRYAVNEILTHPVYKSNVIRLAKEMNGYDTLALFENYVEEVIASRRNQVTLTELAA
jgi:UDP:flavonoid glycosyltransferase YjiC (YdhE family)